MYLRGVESKILSKVISHVFLPTEEKRLLLRTEIETSSNFRDASDLGIARTVMHVSRDIVCCANNGLDDRESGDLVMSFMLAMVLVEMLQEAFVDSMLVSLIHRRFAIRMLFLLGMWGEMVMVDEPLVFLLLLGLGVPVR